eukprot:g26478.t1
MPVGKASSMTRFFEELHQLLGRLSPGRRRAGLAELRPLERQGLEAWILARQSDQAKERRRLQGPKMPRSTQPSSGARSSVVTFSQRTLKGTSRWYYAVVCLPGLHILSRMRRQRHSAVEDSKVLADAKRRVSEASRTGRSFDQAVREALGGSVVARSAGRSVVGGWGSTLSLLDCPESYRSPFVLALRPEHDLDDDHADVTGVEGLPVPRCMLADAIASKTRKKLKTFWDGSQVPVKSATSPGTRRRPRAGSTAFEPQALHLRFYAAVDLGGGFATMLRAPCCYDLDEALRARRRLLAAVHLEEPDQRLSTVPFSRCTVLPGRFRSTSPPFRCVVS